MPPTAQSNVVELPTMGHATLKLTPDERNVLWPEACYPLFDGDLSMSANASAEVADETQERAHRVRRCIDALDLLGWHEHEQRAEWIIPNTPESFREFIEQARDEADENSKGAERHAEEWAKGGDRPRFWPDLTPEERILHEQDRESERAGYRHTLDICNAVLDRLT